MEFTTSSNRFSKQESKDRPSISVSLTTDCFLFQSLVDTDIIYLSFITLSGKSSYLSIDDIKLLTFCLVKRNLYYTPKYK